MIAPLSCCAAADPGADCSRSARIRVSSWFPVPMTVATVSVAESTPAPACRAPADSAAIDSLRSEEASASSVAPEVYALVTASLTAISSRWASPTISCDCATAVWTSPSVVSTVSSVPLAPSTRSCAPARVSCSEAIRSRADPTESTAPASPSIVFPCAPRSRSSASRPALLSSSVTVSATTETNVLLICLSRVVAPTSVIWGATAFDFSLTWYCRLGRMKSPEVTLVKSRLKSAGMMIAAWLAPDLTSSMARPSSGKCQPSWSLPRNCSTTRSPTLMSPVAEEEAPSSRLTTAMSMASVLEYGSQNAAMFTHA